ncbi:unnamed protein product [Brachionus calyciflorus]|uniref:Tyrosine-protein kinase n=1 Tax=Brachionus calyciflorus TaxID=104777 RepID=A0A813S8H1_9BILA|nr:unnamed protein product [Brachionus calyciflorus]
MIKKFAKYAPNKISAKEVETELIRSREETLKLSQDSNYYHESVDRSIAEKLLKDYYNKYGETLDGLFLIRKCSASLGDYSLSMICKGVCYHYRVNHSIDAYYVLDDGPLIHGLDELIKHYRLDPHGLPCRLSTRFVPNSILPSISRVLGYTNPLHLACSCVAEVNKVKLILKSSNKPDINEKDDFGRTALHIACEYDNINALEELIEANAIVNIRARDGSTPLHTAAEFGSIQCLEYLLKCGRANPMERNMTNNWVPLHEAASRDHYTCVNALLNYGLPDKPRTSDNQTPLDLAIECGHKRTAQILRNFIPIESRIKMNEFLHDASVTREKAKQLLDGYKYDNGRYLVRKTQRDENIFVLSLMFNEEFFNYEICLKDQSNGRYYFIDDGPYFRSLPQLIEHYSKYEDGLPGLLTRPISPNVDIVRSSFNNNNTKFSNQPVTRQTSILSSSSLQNQQLQDILTKQLMQTSISSNSSNNFKMDTLSKTNLFKSRTLLNENKRSATNQLSRKLSKISINEIQLQAIIGEGEFGTVYKGTYNGKQVAVKRLKDSTASNDFMREADIMGTFNNPCILKIFGLVQDKNCLMMVQELMICSILEKLWNSPNEVTENHLKLWSSQIALGMQHMEEQKIVHRDLAARNVLLASMSQIKISDFGLSRSTDAFTNAYTQTTEDVWSYGITLWEMFSYGDQPYGNMNGSEVYMYIQSGQRLQRPASCPKNTYKVMLQCWDWEEDKRPTFRELNQFFQNDNDYQKTLTVLKSFR